MNETSPSVPKPNTIPSPKPISTFKRVARYATFKIITLFLAVTIGLYLTILVINLGGYVDEIFRGMIREQIFGMLRGGWNKELLPEERERAIEAITSEMEEGYGLHQPFLVRTLSWLGHGLILDLGEARYQYPNDPRKNVRELVLNRLPYTLILVGTANLATFLTSVLLALNISRKYGGLIDRLMITLSPLSSAPSWVFGVFLILIFAAGLRVLPYPKEINLAAAENWLEYLPYVAEYMVLPFLAICLGAFFQSVYVWRTYFLIYSSEDYVEMAKAKGLHPARIERDYILRPTLPYLLTSFALTTIGLWQGAIALEVLFYWQGIGALFIQAVRRFDTALVVGIVIVFAYTLAITVFVLDIAYAFLDPRVKIISEKQSLRRMAPYKWRWPWSRQADDFPISPGVKSTPPEQSVHCRDELVHTPKARRSTPRFNGLRLAIREIASTPSAMLGLIIILALAGVSLYTVLAIPYNDAVAMWRRQENAGYQNPRTVPPAWVNWFRKDKLPLTLLFDSQADHCLKTVETNADKPTKISFDFTFDYTYTTFPQDLVLFFTPVYAEKMPLVNLAWLRPDGKLINLGQFSVNGGRQAFYLSQDDKLKRRLGEKPLQDGLFGDKKEGIIGPMTGRYTLQVTAFTFEPDSDLEAEMVLYGQAHGWAGTDNRRRDLGVALLWGTPVALAFGMGGAVLTSLLSMIIAAVGVWYGGWVDELIQRVSEINLILPTLAIVIMVYMLYSQSIWAILGTVVLLSIFGSSVKVFRSAFLQMREAPYLEAAQAYGASRMRIVFQYLVPRITPVLIPQLVIMVPGYVFYEATLAYLGLSDPYMPTWGKVIHDAVTVGAFTDAYYWLLEPLALLMLTGLAFAMFGLALDRLLNPRLRQQ